MTSDLTQYAKAAQHLPMAWLTQSEFPAKDLVKQSFEDAIAELPAPQGYEDNQVRSALDAVVAGPDPRGGAFKAQAIYAAAQLHDRVTVLALAPKAKKVRRNSVLHGYCGGLLGESYGHKIVTEVGHGYVVYKMIDGQNSGSTNIYHGDIEDLAEYLVPDFHCPDDCTMGER
jgi:hypothetical protein